MIAAGADLGEVVLRPPTDGQKAEKGDCRDQHGVAGLPNAGCHGHDVADDAQNRNEQRVDGGLLGEPVELGPDIATLGIAERDGVSASQVGVDEDDVGESDREREQPHHRGDEHRPRKQRDPQKVHAGRAQGDDRGGEVDRRQQQGGYHQHRSQKGEGDGVALVGGDSIEGAPTATGEHRRDDDNGADEPSPKRRQGGAWKGDVGGANLKGHDDGGQTDDQRQHDEEDERHPVERPHLEVGVETPEYMVGPGWVETLEAK